MRKTKIGSISFWCILFPLILVYIICSAFRVYLWYEIVIYNWRMGRALRQGNEERVYVCMGGCAFGVHFFDILWKVEVYDCFLFFVVFFMKEKGRKVGNWRGCKFSLGGGCGIRWVCAAWLPVPFGVRRRVQSCRGHFKFSVSLLGLLAKIKV